jgi:hypothetical protein
MSTFLLEQIIINRTLIFRRFKLISHYDSNPFDTLHSFNLINEIVYKSHKEGYICNVVCYFN